MISAGQLLGYAGVSFVLIVIPGPSVMFVVGRALAHGRRVALLSVVGNAVGLYCVAVAVAIGVGALFARSQAWFDALRLAGSLYLVMLGVRALRDRSGLGASVEARPAPVGGLRALREGLLVGVANPKGLILFTAILPQFVNRHAGNVQLQMLLLGLVSFAIALVSDSAWGMLASGARSWLVRSPRRLGRVSAGGGVTLIASGVVLGVTGSRS
jgi:threonine/homoserine/homoserine lactone efflux protein